MPVSLTDSHAHLAEPILFDDVTAVVDRAVAAGVEHILAVGIDLASSATSIALAERFPTVWATVGVHPSEVASFEERTIAELSRLAAHPRVVAIGEIGLDYYRDRSTAELQRSAFAAQVDLAAALGRPVVVHNREADDDVLRILGSVARDSDLATRAGVLHCFSGDAALAERAIGQGFFVSFAGNLTFRRADALRETAAKLPIDWILTETDSPFLAPIPVRGRTNQPANGRLVVDQLAEIRGISPESAALATSANAGRLFRWASP
ncbi:MAG: TatD family hydrolase [Chloroflexota bacterium]